MPQRFNVTFEIVTDESAENGDSEESGFIAQSIGLREAINLVQETNSPHCEQTCVEASDSNISAARWVTIYNGRDWQSGEFENRSIHFPESLSPASRVRIARLLNCYGV